MILKVVLDGQPYPIDVPEEMLEQAGDFFDKLNADMDRGWQMSRSWVDDLDAIQRCQVVADRLLTAMENDNPQMGMLMAAYILKHAPGVTAIDIDTNGDVNDTQLMFGAEQLSY